MPRRAKGEDKLGISWLAKAKWRLLIFRRLPYYFVVILPYVMDLTVATLNFNLGQEIGVNIVV